MNRPSKFPPSHPACQYAARQLREAGFHCEFDNGYMEWFIHNERAAALDRNITKAMSSLCAKLAHRKYFSEWEVVRRIMLAMENQ